MGEKRIYKIRKQSEFCLELMKRLNEELLNSDVASYWHDSVEHYTQRQGDIIRLRRELMALSNELDPWKNRKEN